LPYTALLIDGPDQTILVDTGAGPLDPHSGMLGGSLREAGFRPEQVDTVLLTHARADHIGGLLTQNGEPAFPNATVMISRLEWEFWLSVCVSGRLGAGEVIGVPMIEQLMKQWLENYLFPLSDRIKLVKGDHELDRGIKARPTPGHTPGHLSVEVSSRDKSLVYFADLIDRRLISGRSNFWSEVVRCETEVVG
jgi:glyoxylase-like metal-dependent hydrolase (beta-lactamase superfamily II)